jgi:hypothetical protein
LKNQIRLSFLDGRNIHFANRLFRGGDNRRRDAKRAKAHLQQPRHNGLTTGQLAA